MYFTVAEEIVKQAKYKTNPFQVE